VFVAAGVVLYRQPPTPEEGPDEEGEGEGEHPEDLSAGR
jgi:hypothetical protein